MSVYYLSGASSQPRRVTRHAPHISGRIPHRSRTRSESWAAPTNPEPQYKRHTPRRRIHAPNLLGLLGQAEAT